MELEEDLLASDCEFKCRIDDDDGGRNTTCEI